MHLFQHYMPMKLLKAPIPQLNVQYSLLQDLHDNVHPNLPLGLSILRPATLVRIRLA